MRAHLRTFASLGLACLVALLFVAVLIDARSPGALRALIAAVSAAWWGWVIGAFYVKNGIEEAEAQALKGTKK